MSCVCYAFGSVHCCLEVTCWVRADILVLVCDVNCVFVTFPCGILVQVWYLIVSIPDLCHLSYFLYQLSLYAGQKYCRMLQGEHSAIFSTFIKLTIVIKIFVLSIFEWPFYTGFTVLQFIE